MLPPADFRQVLIGYRRGLHASPAIEAYLAGAVGDLPGAPGTRVRAQLAYGVGRALGLELADARALPFAGGSFDGVILSFALHDMPRPVRLRVLAEAVRVARGKVVVLDYAFPRRGLRSWLPLPLALWEIPAQAATSVGRSSTMRPS